MQLELKLLQLYQSLKRKLGMFRDRGRLLCCRSRVGRTLACKPSSLRSHVTVIMSQ